MNKPSRSINEATLNVNLNELAHNLVREMSMACRKVGIYGANHPVGTKAVEKPFFAFDRIFTFKKFVNFNIQQGHLFVLNIRLKESPFTEEIVRHMQVFDLQAMLFERRLSMVDLTRFLDRFVKRMTMDDHSNLMGTFLKQYKIDTIETNTERAFGLFEAHRQYRGDVDGDFSVKSAALHQMGEDLAILADINERGEGALLQHNIDFTFDVIQYLLPEKINSLEAASFVESFAGLAAQTDSSKEPADGRDPKQTYAAIWKLLDYHPDRNAIIEQVQMTTASDDLLVDVAREVGDAVSAIRIESRDRVDQLIAECLEDGEGEYPVSEFVGAFQRLLKTGQRGKAIEVLSRMLDYLTSNETTFRGRALDMLIALIGQCDILSDQTIYEHTVDQINKALETQQESFEYCEFVWRLCERALAGRQFDKGARIAEIVGRRRRLVNGLSVFDSIGIKKIIESMNRGEIVSLLIDELVRTDGDHTAHIRSILSRCGGEQAAIGLSQIISHPVRQVRQQALKILAELGKDSVKVFTQILMDDSMFDRDYGRYELPDAKWYVIRNSIFVLGLLADPEGIAPLRLRINDPDIRVRREIVSTLEKIGGEDAADLLVVMSEDPDREIREKAIIAVGLIGTAEMAPLVIDVIERTPTLALRGVTALGKIGGEAAAGWLGRLLSDHDAFNHFAETSAGKDDLRLAVVKALGEIGDQNSIARLKEFKDSLSAAQKILFRNSSVNKTLSEILSRH